MSDCQKPGCLNSPDETYKGKHGNELDLCSKHYYELVSGEKTTRSVLTPSGGLGLGTDFTTQFEEPETRGVRDTLLTETNEYTDTKKNDVRIPNPTQGEYIAD